MNQDGLTLALPALALTLILLASLAWLWGRGLWRESGLPDGSLIASDMEEWHRQTGPLYSAELQLAGHPDYLVARPDGSLTPVEIKSSPAPAEPYASHVMQLAAYCLLVKEVHGVRPSHGILQYRDRAFAVEYTPQIEEELLNLLNDMHQDRYEADVDRDHDEPRRCARCGLRASCSQRLA
jgi:CRISPR-associated exonuclease Cas4